MIDFLRHFRALTPFLLIFTLSTATLPAEDPSGAGDVSDNVSASALSVNSHVANVIDTETPPNVPDITNASSAETASWRVTGLTVGIGGCYKNGMLTPATVYVERKINGNGGKTDGVASEAAGGESEKIGETGDATAEFLVRLTTIDSDGTPTFEEKKGTLSTSEGKGNVDFLFSSGREDGSLTIQIRDPATGTVWAERSVTPGTVDSPATAEKTIAVDLTKETGRTGQTDRTNPEDSAKKADKTGKAESSNRETDRSNAVIFPKPVGTGRPIWMALGGQAEGVACMLGSLHLPEERTPYLLHIQNPAELPTTADGLAAVDLIILDAGQPEFYDGLTHDAPVLQGIRDSILRGAEAALFGGANSLPLLKKGGILADLVPGTVRSESVGELRSAPTLVQYVPKAKNLVMLGSLDSPYLHFPVLTETTRGSVIELTEGEKGGAPLLVRRPMGMGSLLFFAPNPDESPLADWSGRSGLLMKIFADEIESLTAGMRETGLIQLGYGDLSGQMRSALDRFDGVRNVPFSVVLALIFLFVLTIGPIDWLLTHRLFKRPNLTWLTLPIWILLFAGIAAGIGKSFHPESLRINRVDLIDVDTASGLIRGSSWTGLYSPSDLCRDLRLVPVFPDTMPSAEKPEIRLSWLGLAGNGLGGMSSPIKTVSPWPNGYRTEVDNGVLRGFPVPVRSTKSLFGSWFTRTATEFGSRLTFENDRLTGTFDNPFPSPLENGILLYNGRGRLLGTLNPGENPLDPSIPSTDEVSRILAGTTNPFQGRLAVGNDKNIEKTGEWPKYSEDSADPEAILRLIMFYQAAGGGKSTGLADAQHARLDASALYRRETAVLVGRLRGFHNKEDAPAPLRTDLMTADADGSERLWASETEKEAGRLDRHAVYVRFFIPVERIGKEKER